MVTTPETVRRMVNAPEHRPDELAKYKAMHGAALGHIRQLEGLNTALAAQVDRMRPVITAAKEVVDTGKVLPIHMAYTTYEKQMAQLAKEGE
jgi:hypothetical protein